MRCLPAMDPDAQSYVRTIGHYAMRQLLHSMRNNSNNNNSYNSSASATATRRYSSLMSSSPIQRHSHYHGSSATLLSNKTAGIASSHAGSSNAGSTTLAQHPLLKTSSTCLNDVHPTTHYSLPQESATLCKADAWVPPRMIDDTSAPLRPHQHHNRYHNHHCQSNNTCQQQHNNNHHSQPQPLPQQQHQQQGHPYPRMIQQQQRQEDQDGRTPPVANSGSSPLPTSSSLFSSPLMQHISRPYHAAKLRRWFKKHNKVAPVDGQH
ncbi:hypothetical protein BDB00DRAFT_814111 [Zychaea mexicana]|uniref:uncharacterized protein n=1 Tax=Zychaea mexicana TaxID=64656 RepID=UPI0022FE48DA|nr:uncharacterized protein BDB00DRAFT_814111 [Zychaea mexicana]KAI9495313.1 hypothetical protein BDB00DRAFT_814111 [Zychaea mexicana]